MEDAIKVWVPSIAPSGLTLYRGDKFPQWNNSLLVGALADKEVRRLALQDGKVTSEEALFTEVEERIRDVRVSPAGDIYLLTDSSEGNVLRVIPN